MLKDILGSHAAGFGKSLADTLEKRYPPKLDLDAAKRPSVNRMTRIVEELCAKAAEFSSEHSTGWLGKARMAHALKWALHEKGYSDEFVTLVVESLTVSLTKKSAKKSG